MAMVGVARTVSPGRSLRPSWAPFTRSCLRSGIHASACQLRRLDGTDNPSRIHRSMKKLARPSGSRCQPPETLAEVVAAVVAFRDWPISDLSP